MIPTKYIFEVELILKNDQPMREKFSCFEEAEIPMLAEKRGLKIKAYTVTAKYAA